MNNVKDRLIEEMKKLVPFVLAVAVIYVPLFLLGITCPIKYLTGVSCAGCGMTRAWVRLFHLDFAGAFHYHPLFFLPPLVLVAFLFRGRLPKTLYRAIMFTAVTLFVIVYVYRLFCSQDTIVVFQPKEGMLLRIFFDIQRRIQ